MTQTETQIAMWYSFIGKTVRDLDQVRKDIWEVAPRTIFDVYMADPSTFSGQMRVRGYTSDIEAATTVLSRTPGFTVNASV